MPLVVLNYFYILNFRIPVLWDTRGNIPHSVIFRVVSLCVRSLVGIMYFTVKHYILNYSKVIDRSEQIYQTFNSFN